MGRKYASVFVLTKQPEPLMPPILSVCESSSAQQLKEVLENLERVKDEIGALYYGELRLLSLMEEARTVVQAKETVAIYDEEFSFVSVEKFARKLSKQVSAPVVYVSNFDDDFFLFGVLVENHRVTEGTVGSELWNYGLKEKKPNWEKMNAFFSEEQISIVKATYETGEIADVEVAFEQLLKTPLDMYWDLDRCQLISKGNGVGFYKEV